MAIAEAELTTLFKTGMPITEDELLRLPKDGPDNLAAARFELVDGRLASRPAATFLAGATAANLVCLIGPSMKGRGVGSVGRAGFHMSNGNVRAPSVSFTRTERIPGGRPGSGFGSVAPDLCVEIISPSERPADIADKLHDYFDSGANVVWHVFPEMQSVTVWTSRAEMRSFSGEEVLDARDLLPGFTCRVSEIFRAE